MFGCCNNLFSSSCRCNRCNSCDRCSGGSTVLPVPIFPPVTPTPTPTPTEPLRLRGVEATLTAGSGGTVANGFPIPFNNLVSNNAIGASFVTGAITLNRSGTYLVNWWVAMGETEDAEAANGQTATTGGAAPELSFSAALNGNIVSGSYAPSGTGQISGSALVTVMNTPSTLQVVNSSGGNVLLAQTSVQAGVTVTQLA